ncbi:beta expansin8 [Zea mays]|uniref:Beta expansin8 n=1 Tax=Zea mays TaxID=4577 RepID=A0A1D6P6W6_MAIZE|nr:beta expansin8 [Zea mays]
MESKTARGPPTGRWTHPQRVRQDARRQQRHPGQLAPQHLLPLLRPVQLELAGWGATRLGHHRLQYYTMLYYH